METSGRAHKEALRVFDKVLWQSLVQDGIGLHNKTLHQSASQTHDSKRNNVKAYQEAKSMVNVWGYLKEEATTGERRVLETLKVSLPQDFHLYIECPLHDGDMERMPDFIVLTTFGVIVLEVKDWFQIEKADKYNATVRQRSGKTMEMRNPVTQARRFAEILAQKLEHMPDLLGERHKLKVPWGYAVVMPNLGTAMISQLRRVWGETGVLALVDLRPDLVTRKLKSTLPFDYDLHREDLRYIRSVINPTILFEVPDQNRVGALDEEQERIVIESPKAVLQKPTTPEAAGQKPETLQLFSPLVPKPPEELVKQQATDNSNEPEEIEQLMHDFSIRLVRGIAGSGKTLVLTQRARYLAAQHPNWNICVLTYNAPLAENLQANLRGVPNVKVGNFDRLCSALYSQMATWSSPHNAKGFLTHHVEQLPIVKEFGAAFVEKEIVWIKDTGIESREDYLVAERKGRGKGLPRRGPQREALYDALEAYDTWLAQHHHYDWADVPKLVFDGMETGSIQPELFDAVLIDEAQDFAPSWFKVVKRWLKPGGLIFLADDPSQSIYRYFSWREKGIPVVGRTKWLRVPYRNTREIYLAAYEVIKDDEVLQQQLEEQLGMTLTPEFENQHLRSGSNPQIREFRNEEEEFNFIRNEIHWLLQKGHAPKSMIVLHRRKNGVNKIEHALRGTGIEVCTFHAPKGLEYETVFMTQMHETFRENTQEPEPSLSTERRLVYMAMTRARERLYLTASGRWPIPLECIRQYSDCA